MPRSASWFVRMARRTCALLVVLCTTIATLPAQTGTQTPGGRLQGRVETGPVPFIEAQGVVLSIYHEVGIAVQRPDYSATPDFPKSLKRWRELAARDPATTGPFEPCVTLMVQAGEILKPVAPLMKRPAWDTSGPQINAATRQAHALLDQARDCIQRVQPGDVFSSNSNPNAKPGPLERPPETIEFPIPPAFDIFVPGLQNIADVVNFLSTYHPVETAYVGIGIAGGRLAAMGFPSNAVTVQQAVGGTRYTGNAAVVLAQDARISRVAPAVRALTRPIGRSVTQNQVLQDDIAALQKMGATQMRVNQQQVAAAGQRVGINRPDLQFTLNGQRYYIEYDTPASGRGLAHAARLLANDPNAIIILKIVP